MAGDPGGRRLLPQSSQMQSFSFAPNNFGSRENQKSAPYSSRNRYLHIPVSNHSLDYVFVDEHNRHKRLKGLLSYVLIRLVMRACEGCRRRKIKCDAATTNTWPCSACIRLKLHCVPPTVNYDRDFPSGPQVFEPERGEYESGGSGDDEYHQQMSIQQHTVNLNLATVNKCIMGIYTPLSASLTNINIMGRNQSFQLHLCSTLRSKGRLTHQYGQRDLSELLGELRMDEAGTAPYLNNRSKNKTLVEDPAYEDVDDYKNVLPPSLSGPDMKVRIPPELMPDEETILHYFDMYFSNVHPYVPVLNKTLFYHQWHTNREAISPLILEAIFAIAGRLADEPSQGQQWLALSGKHADSFMDVPRLSTLQAMLIVLKARESAPKRGYYFRSWMTVVQCVQMAKDLGLDEHYEEHKAGRPCGSDLADCITKTRIWQTIFCYLAVEIETLDLSVPRPVPGVDDSEFHVTRTFSYFIRLVRNVRRMNNVYSRIKKKKEWGIDPDLVQLNPSFDAWMNDLPGDLQVTFPQDGSPPWLASHFIGNLHSYYYLGVIMLHRPQLTFMEPTGVDGGWKHHMMICYSSAKLLCRLQEATLQSFGLTGLLCMQRGINFTIYCVLTCTVLHLVAITSPDPDLNGDAREYFTRHMRILEKCTSSWPMPDMQQQIDALREAFSADTRKPFVLKPSFPYGSPNAPVNSTPPRVQTQYRQGSSHSSSMDQQTMTQQQVSYTNHHPISPPISAGGVDPKSDSPAIQSLVMMASGQRAPQQQQPMASGMTEPAGWNPSRIFDTWNTTFGTPPAAASTSAPQQPPLKIAVAGAHGIHDLPQMQTLPNVLNRWLPSSIPGPPSLRL
ncbi:Nitrogen assimilation transcription factor nit-4 [Hyphodiscus hymeniophilus]|uniref:Nitrogen assimilation transcription factor nit-4 n=1 Tax=Hyphodiscus hymeniophilus TaxID=353542 RepID=A0A9P6VNZ3_9HELO|nr:Nitrogen assimilation transcription factor nit-4 [Hyphodiscus hymeniophilus]